MATDRVGRLLSDLAIARTGHVDAEIWERIHRGVSVRHRRRVASRAIGAGAVIAGSVAMLWFAASRGSPDHVVAPKPLGIASVRLVRSPALAIVVVISNDRDRAWRVRLVCTALNADGHKLVREGRILTELRVPGHASARKVLPLASSDSTRVASARCQISDAEVALPVPSPTTSPLAPTPGLSQTPPPKPPQFIPMKVAFWTASSGIAAGRIEVRPCDQRCVGAVALTHDGGRHWRVVRRGWYELATPSIAILGTSDVWLA